MFQLFDIPIFFGFSMEVFVILLFISIPTYIFFYMLFRNRITDKIKRNLSIWVSTIILTLLIYVGIFAAFIYFLLRQPPNKAFDQSKWIIEKNERFLMGDDLVKSKILNEKDTIQIKQILGQPTWKDSLNTSWTYDMGSNGSGFGLLFHSLSVKFENNKAVKIEHFQVQD
jgi:hypothetical protein